MSNLIILFLSIIISYLIFFLEKENLLMSLVQASFLNGINKSTNEGKSIDSFYNSSIGRGVSKKEKRGFEIDTRNELKKKSENINTKISSIRKELNSNLKHLEFILMIENQLVDLATKDKYTIERLQKYVKVKIEVQLKIIQLSQRITNYNSSQINLC